MPKNKGLGGKFFRKGKKGSDLITETKLITKIDGAQDYGRVKKILGDRRVNVLCNDGVLRLCSIPGKFRKRIWINIDDVVLVNLRDYQDEKAELSYRYSQNEIKKLIKLEHLNSTIFELDNNNDDDVSFESSSDDNLKGTLTPQREYDIPDDIDLDDL